MPGEVQSACSRDERNAMLALKLGADGRDVGRRIVGGRRTAGSASTAICLRAISARLPGTAPFSFRQVELGLRITF